MSQLYLSLVFHNHQPVGNFDFVFEKAYTKAYKPLTDCLDRHPTIQVAMHFTGPLLDWLTIHHPEYLEQVATQVRRGQVELLSGGYYEPILSMLQDSDKLGQIQKLNTTIEQWTGQAPTGMWLAERIWEPHFPLPLHQSNIEYTIIDDTHFTAAGFTEDKLFGYFATDEQGAPLKLVPTRQELRHLMPWSSVQSILDWLQEQAVRQNLPGKPPALAVMGDDGEKFGYWQNTYQKVWEEGWMDAFFEALENNTDWLQTIQPGEYVRKHRALGQAYLPAAGYQEMGEWSLPAKSSWILHDLREQYKLQLELIPDWDRNKTREIENVLRFLTGGFWRNFLVKYPEINHMQKRGLVLSKRLHALPPGKIRDQALEALWASQCNCAYWHGVFGGVYLVHIRMANYRNLIYAESLIDPQDELSLEQFDFNGDTRDEVIASNGIIKLLVEPGQGGMITELDYRPAFYNLLNIMTRYPEGYHNQIQEAAETNMIRTQEDDPLRFEGEPVLVKERGLENYLFEDWHRRGMFIDHFPGAQTTLELFESVHYPEQGDFVDQHYDIQTESTENSLTIDLVRNGHLWVGNVRLPVQVKKSLSLARGETKITAAYQITNQGDIRLKTRFGVETSHGYDGGDNPDYCYMKVDNQIYDLKSTRELEAIQSYYTVSKLRDFGVRITLSDPATLWHFPLAPISLSDGGFERVHQGMVLFQWWHLDLAPGESQSFTIALEIESLKQEK